MGKDKSRLRLWNRTLLAHVRSAAAMAELPVRVIRRDLVPKCGPLGGVYTALRTTKADAVLFLSCDMPFITSGLLAGLESRLRSPIEAVFTQCGKKGFPFIVRTSAIGIVQEALERKELSLQQLARRLKAVSVRPKPKDAKALLFNINTPEEYAAALERPSPLAPCRC